ncbi:hypothetical protein SF83666_c28040 [Sinorhizobium fredii CCBAU 83666]|nr:hypothetical protein SF83666_c28040 [Sinorhizobium fredii CCBAU 83666]
MCLLSVNAIASIFRILRRQVEISKKLAHGGRRAIDIA